MNLVLRLRAIGPPFLLLHHVRCRSHLRGATTALSSAMKK
jgi:hypothetical protein